MGYVLVKLSYLEACELINLISTIFIMLLYIVVALVKGTNQAGTFMSLKCVVYYANYRSWHQSSKIQVVS